MEEILASIRRIIADDDSLPGVRREERRRPREEAEALTSAFSAYPAPALERLEDEPQSPPVVEARDATPPMADIRHLRIASREPEPEVESYAPVEEDEEPSIETVLEPESYLDESDESFSVAEIAAAPGGPLMSADAAASIASQFQTLAASMVINDSGLLHKYAREMLRPMLKQWLDDNLPVIVERLVRAEIERVARGGRR